MQIDGRQSALFSERPKDPAHTLLRVYAPNGLGQDACGCHDLDVLANHIQRGSGRIRED
jgi:hypothetical protein